MILLGSRVVLLGHQPVRVFAVRCGDVFAGCLIVNLAVPSEGVWIEAHVGAETQIGIETVAILQVGLGGVVFLVQDPNNMALSVEDLDGDRLQVLLREDVWEDCVAGAVAIW